MSLPCYTIPAYRETNADGITPGAGRVSRCRAGPLARLKMQRMPLLNRQREGANWLGLLDPEAPVAGRYRRRDLRPEIAAIAVPATGRWDAI